MTVEALDEAEDHILLSGISDEGDLLTREVCDRLLTIHGTRGQDVTPNSGAVTRLNRAGSESQALIRRSVSERNARFFEAEADKLDGWADDLKVGLEREIKEIDRLIKEARRAATTALTLEEKLAGQKQIKTLEATRNQKRRSLFDAQDQIDRQRADLITQIESKLEPGRELFSHLNCMRQHVRIMSGPSISSDLTAFKSHLSPLGFFCPQGASMRANR